MLKLRNPFKKKLDDRLEFVAKVGGHNFFKLKGHIIQGQYIKRHWYFVRLLRSFDELKLPQDKRTAIYDGIDKALNEQNFAAIAQYNTLMRQLDDATATNEQYFTVANCFLLLEGEPVDTLDDVFTNKKRELYKDNEDIRFFLRSFAHEQLKDIISTSPSTPNSEYLDDMRAQIIKGLSSKLGLNLL